MEVGGSDVGYRGKWATRQGELQGKVGYKTRWATRGLSNFNVTSAGE